jgi:hypothetical protein
MQDERQWVPMAVIWDEEVGAPQQPPFGPPRSFGAPPTAPAGERPRPQRTVAERPERRDEQPRPRRDKGRAKPRQKKLRPHDLDDEG